MRKSLENQAEAFAKLIEYTGAHEKLRARCERLRKVALAAESYGMENDIGDDCYEALDALHLDDLNDDLGGSQDFSTQEHP